METVHDILRQSQNNLVRFTEAVKGKDFYFEGKDYTIRVNGLSVSMSKQPGMLCLNVTDIRTGQPLKLGYNLFLHLVSREQEPEPEREQELPAGLETQLTSADQTPSSGPDVDKERVFGED